MKLTGTYRRQMAPAPPAGCADLIHIHLLHKLCVKKAKETTETLSRILYMKKNMHTLFIKENRNRYVQKLSEDRLSKYF